MLPFFRNSFSAVRAKAQMNLQLTIRTAKLLALTASVMKEKKAVPKFKKLAVKARPVMRIWVLLTS